MFDFADVEFATGYTITLSPRSDPDRCLSATFDAANAVSIPPPPSLSLSLSPHPYISKYDFSSHSLRRATPFGVEWPLNLQ